MTLRRRSFLIGSSIIAASAAGCADPVNGNRPKIDLELFNYTADEQPLIVEVLRVDTDEYSEARVLNQEFSVPPPREGESAGVLRESDVVPRRRYLLRVLPKYGRGEWYTHHFYPGESTSDPDSERFDIRIYRDEETEALYVRFT